jgi:ABC-type glycerol-3-phosphate transport system substrate-binding protein
MKKRILTAAAAALLALALVACSSGEKATSDTASQEQAAPKSAVKRFTDKTAEKIEKHITTPLDKARATQNLGEERNEAMDKALQENTGE